MNEKIYIGLSCVIFIIVLYVYWYYIRPRHYEKLYQKLKQFKGLKKSHLTDQPKDEPQVKPITNTNCHMLIYGTSGRCIINHDNNNYTNNEIINRKENHDNNKYTNNIITNNEIINHNENHDNNIITKDDNDNNDNIMFNRTLIVGPSFCGKSHLLLNKLQLIRLYDKEKQIHIITISGTIYKYRKRRHFSGRRFK